MKLRASPGRREEAVNAKIDEQQQRRVQDRAAQPRPVLAAHHRQREHPEAGDPDQQRAVRLGAGDRRRVEGEEEEHRQEGGDAPGQEARGPRPEVGGGGHRP
jgi:hypothetical protein